MQFKFLDPRIYWPYAGTGIESAPLNPKELVHHKDPFYSECRAFGRLKEARREDLAVHCYGYIVVDSKHEEDVLRRFQIASWNRSKGDEGKPIRAIVKELVRSDQPFVPKMIPKMMRDLRAINSLGIQVWDVKDDMYLGGILLDLSQARTVPHIELDLQSGIWERSFIISEGTSDYENFDGNVIDHWNRDHDEQIWDRFEPSRWYRKRLRTFTRRYLDPSDIPIAALYDWKKVSKKRTEKKDSTMIHKRVFKKIRRKKNK